MYMLSIYLLYRDVFEVQTDHTPMCAIFYSVNSPHSALAGLDLAPIMIRRVAMELATRYPSLHTFSTLSPIPQFVPWVKKIHKIPHTTPTNTSTTSSSSGSGSKVHIGHITAIKSAVLAHLQGKRHKYPMDLLRFHRLLCNTLHTSGTGSNSSSKDGDIGTCTGTVTDTGMAKQVDVDVEEMYNMIIAVFYMDHKKKLSLVGVDESVEDSASASTSASTPVSTPLSLYMEPIIKYMVGYYLLHAKHREGREPYGK